jgi:hypothetical protein
MGLSISEPTCSGASGLIFIVPLTQDNYVIIDYQIKESNYWSTDYGNQKQKISVPSSVVYLLLLHFSSVLNHGIKCRLC